MDCPICKESFSDAEQLADHLVNAHTKRKAEDTKPPKRQKLDERLPCLQCAATFASKKTLQQHTKNVHTRNAMLACPECGKEFADRRNLDRHLPIHASTSTAPSNLKPKPLRAKRQLERGKPQRVEATKEEMQCAQCGKKFRFKNHLERHIETHLREAEERATPPKLPRLPIPDDPRKIDEAPDMEAVFENPPLADVYAKNWPNIRSLTTKNRFVTQYRLRLPNSKTPIKFLADVFARQRSSFLINIQLGFVLQHIETREVIFFYGSNNTWLFPNSFRITSRKDFKHFMKEFHKIDLDEHCRQQRPNSKWVLLCISTFAPVVSQLNDPIKAGQILPKWLRNHKGIRSLDADKTHSRPYSDSLCMFRCLALFRGADIQAINEPAKALLRQWLRFKQMRKADFNGVGELELDDFEKCFDVAISAYDLVPLIHPEECDGEDREEEDLEDLTRLEEKKAAAIKKRKFTAQLVRRTKRKDREIMFINLFTAPNGRQHASLITDFAVYASSFQCKKCLMTFPHRGNSQKHEKNCNGSATKEIFKGNGFCIKPSIFQRLHDEGIVVPQQLRFHPFRICFDFESTSEERQYVRFTPFPATEATLPAEDEEFVHAFRTSFSHQSGIYSFREPNLDLLPEYARALAEIQRCRFEMKIEAITFNGKIKKTTMLEKTMINGEMEFEEAMAALQLNLLLLLLGEQDLRAVDIRLFPKKQQFIADCVPASVAIASNLPEFSEAGRPKAIFLLSNGDPQDLVDRFVKQLEEIAKASKKVMLKRFDKIINRLKSLEKVCIRRVADIRASIGKQGGRLSREELQQLSKDDRANFFHYLRQKKCFCQLRKDLEKFSSVIPVLGFNSQKFDLNLIRPYLAKSLVDSNGSVTTIKRGSSYMQIKTPLLSFLDITNYLAAGTSYSKWLKCYGIEEGKSHWPHDAFTSLQFLEQDHLPAQEEYYTQLKGCGISDEDYAELQRIWEVEGFQNMGDMLKYYNSLDVLPFLDATAKMFEFWKGETLDMFTDAISLPGLALKQMMLTKPAHINFVLPDEAHKKIFYDIKANMVGGQSIIYHRFQEKGVTLIKDGKMCQKIIGYDANALYLDSMMKALPTQVPRVFTLHDDGRFHGKRMYKYATAELECLEYESLLRGEVIRHRFNYGQQILIAGIQVDGFIPAKRQVFFFDGCWFHGHICYLTSRSRRQFPEDWQTRRFRDSVNRKRLRDLGYEVFVFNECDWEAKKKTDPRVQEFRRKYFALPSHGGPMTQAKLISEIRKGKFFGLVTCDIEVPDSDKPFWDQFPPIFKVWDKFPPTLQNCELRREDIGEHMLAFAIKHKIMEQPRRTLVASFFAKEQTFATPLLKWFIEHGLIIRRVYSAVEYFPFACFEEFGQRIAQARRDADLNAVHAILAELRKLIGNSCYGKLMTAVERHLLSRFVDDEKAQELMRSPFVANVDAMSEDCMEVSMRKKKIVHDLYNPISFFVYANAKRRVLEFVYDFIDKFVDRSDYQIMETDTDSIYMAISGQSLEDIIKPELRSEYESVRDSFLPRKGEWAKYDERTPGLWKLEASGDGMICHNSKTYYLKGQKDKLSSKGLSKTLNKLTWNDYREVLESKNPYVGIGRGFKMIEGHLGRIDTIKNGLTYFYAKREVLADGVSTRTIDHV